MIPKNSALRVARPTDNLKEVSEQYIKGLGFKKISEFTDHDGFSGVIIGHENHSYHFEFTHHLGTCVGMAPTQDNLLVFYIKDKVDWQVLCENMLLAGFIAVLSYNPYWDVNGKTFEDVDGYRVVLENT